MEHSVNQPTLHWGDPKGSSSRNVDPKGASKDTSWRKTPLLVTLVEVIDVATFSSLLSS